MKLLHGAALALLLLAAAAHAQRTPRTHAGDAAALNAVFAKLGQKASSSWNISGNPCSGAATDDTPLDDNPNFNPAIKCDCTDQNGTLCHVTRLKINSLDAAGPIPEELRNLTHLIKLDFRKNSLTGLLPAFIGELTSLKYITVGTNALSGPVPKELWNLTDLVSLALGSNHFNGSLPDELGKLTKLQQLCTLIVMTSPVLYQRRCPSLRTCQPCGHQTIVSPGRYLIFLGV
uniref:Disease resistance R13L4/SHOC-2-like LRR domain-containing protein n=1 Tax=Aegilops tauschii subsp. strangulata TaxID=200361 RepID=A0A453CQD3_AEGTS